MRGVQRRSPVHCACLLGFCVVCGGQAVFNYPPHPKDGMGHEQSSLVSRFLAGTLRFCVCVFLIVIEGILRS